jgi:23S rRNA pseudouridine2457 synthase
MSSNQTISHQHFLIYKPYGYLSQFVTHSSKQQRKKLLGDLYDFPEHIMSIGRLDEKSEGLLFLTTDGSVSNMINAGGVEKEYCAQLDGDITEAAVKTLAEGVEIGLEGKKYQTKKCKAFKLNTPPSLPSRKQKIRDARHGPTSWVSISLTEGKFRQVRKMTSAVGYPTLRLVRVRIGNKNIAEIQPAQVIEIPDILAII